LPEQLYPEVVDERALADAGHARDPDARVVPVRGKRRVMSSWASAASFAFRLSTSVIACASNARSRARIPAAYASTESRGLTAVPSSLSAPIATRCTSVLVGTGRENATRPQP